MRIVDILSQKQTLSYEIFPPKGEMPLFEAMGVSEGLAEMKPDWISVTFSAGGSGNSDNTFKISRGIQEELGINALAHLTCMGATVEEMHARVLALRENGIQNVLALRGDRMPGRETLDFSYAADLIDFLKEADPSLCIGAACYPEGHVECDNLDLSIEHLKMKQDAGADFLVTQLFFENEDFYRFREACSRARIKIPIVCGVMPFTSIRQIQRMAFTCGASIPAKVIRRLVAVGDDDDAQRKAGVEYACEQLEDLAANGVDGIHIYTMNRVDVGVATHDALVSCGYWKD